MLNHTGAFILSGKCFSFQWNLTFSRRKAITCIKDMYRYVTWQADTVFHTSFGFSLNSNHLLRMNVQLSIPLQVATLQLNNVQLYILYVLGVWVTSFFLCKIHLFFPHHLCYLAISGFGAYFQLPKQLRHVGNQLSVCFSP